MKRILFGILLLALAIVSRLSKPSWDTAGFYFLGVPGSLLIHLALLSRIREYFRLDLDLEDSYLKRIEEDDLPLVASARELSKKVHVAFCVAGFFVGWAMFDPSSAPAVLFSFIAFPFLGYIVLGIVLVFAGILLSYMSHSLLSPISQHAHMEFCAALRVPFITIGCITLTVFCGVFLWLPF